MVPRATWYKVSGANLHVQKPFVAPFELEVRVKVYEKVTSTKLKNHPAAT